MGDFYSEMQGVATKLLAEFNQGVIKYIENEMTGADPFNPSISVPIKHALNAVAKGVEQRYIKEGYISASDIQVTSAVFDVEPTMSGVIEIDGKEKQIIAIQQIPAAGLPVSWLVFCKS